MVMYVSYMTMYDVPDMLDAFNGIMMSMMFLHDVYLNMMMYSILSMFYDDERHVAS